MQTVLLMGVFTTAGFLLTAAPLLSSSPLAESLLRSRLLPGRKVVRLLVSPEKADHGVPLSLLTDRKAWLAGYLNLLDGKFDSETASPVRYAPYERLLDAAKWSPRTDVLRFLSVGYYLAPPNLPVSGLRRLGSEENVVLYQDPRSYPMLRLWRNVQPMRTDDAALEAILRGERVDHRVLVTGLAAGESAALAGGGGGRGRGSTAISDQIRLRSFGLNRVEVEVAASAPAVLTLNQIDAVGWTVDRDGQSARALRANGMFRAVYVPEGVHRIVWSYRPRSFLFWLVISVVTGLALLIISLRQRKMRHDA